MEKVSKIFDSSARVKIMRLFLFNDQSAYSIDDIIERSKVSRSTARKEINLLMSTGFLKKKTFTIEVTIKPKAKKAPTKKTKAKKGEEKKTPEKPVAKIEKKKVQGWILDDKFPLAKPLRELLIEGELIGTKTLHKRFEKSGKIKMLVLSGIFMKDTERNVDMILVGDKLDMKKVDSTMATLESEVGKELRYSIFTPEEFQYRLSMYDQHLLDIFEYPHERVVDKLGLV